MTNGKSILVSLLKTTRIRTGRNACPTLELDPVGFYLRVKSRGFNVQQSRRPRLMTAGLIQRQPYQAAFKPFDLPVKVDAFREIKTLQPVRMIGESFVTRERFSLSQERARDIEQALNAAARGSFKLKRRRHGRRFSLPRSF